MQIKYCQKIDIKKYFPNASCEVYVIHVSISNVEERAKEMIRIISSTSWIEKLSEVDAEAFWGRALPTIKKLTNEVFVKVESKITKEFGEYLVSMSAQDALVEGVKHEKIPLAELFKEKMSGNPGFDFHTESHTNIIAFGEAKYSGTNNTYNTALIQIAKFIKKKKDIMELSDLSKFVSQDAARKAIRGEKAYVAAFSLNSPNPSRIWKNVLKDKEIEPLLEYPELYLIGVEVCDSKNNTGRR